MFVETPQVLPLRNVGAMRRAKHEREIKRRRDERAERLARGAYLEDDTDWSRVRELAAAVSEEVEQRIPDNLKVRAALIDAFRATEPLSDPDAEFEAQPEFDALSARFRLLEAGIHAGLCDGLKSDAEDPRQVIAESTAGFRAYIGATVAELHGLVDMEGRAVPIVAGDDGLLPVAALDILELNELLIPLQALVMEFHNLDPFSRPTFGGAPPSISAMAGGPATSARPVPPPGELQRVVAAACETAEDAAPTSPEPAPRPTSAPVARSASTSGARSPSTPAATAGTSVSTGGDT